MDGVGARPEHTVPVSVVGVAPVVPFPVLNWNWPDLVADPGGVNAMSWTSQYETAGVALSVVTVAGKSGSLVVVLVTAV